jgi:hypothetical protein
MTASSFTALSLQRLLKRRTGSSDLVVFPAIQCSAPQPRRLNIYVRGLCRDIKPRALAAVAVPAPEAVEAL